VKVNTDTKTGKVKYASAHDLRRSFGSRWAPRVMPIVLQQLMRHESIETTQKHYVGRDAEAMADEIWQAAERVGTSVGTSRFESSRQEAK
jgi:integrase